MINNYLLRYALIWQGIRMSFLGFSWSGRSGHFPLPAKECKMSESLFGKKLMNEKRPKHLALHHIKFPLPSIVSGLHRVSGVLLFVALPLLLLSLQYSLRSIETFTLLASMMKYPLSKLLLLGVLWAFFHHFCAGVRFLAIDLDYGVKLAQARASSKWVLGVSLTLTLLTGAWLW